MTVELMKTAPTQVSSLPAVRKDLSRYVTPSAPARNFTGRQDILDRLDRFFITSLSSTETEKEQRIFVLYGLGGVGKSQIAYKFLDKYRDRLALRAYMLALEV